MNRDPAHHRPHKSRHSQPPSIPTLGSTCRSIREARGLSRDASAAYLKVSRSHLADIERDRRAPTEELLEHLIVGYQLDLPLARHLRELRATADNLEPSAVLRDSVTTNPALVCHLQGLHERGAPAAYVDSAWTVLTCNDAFRKAAPGLGAGDSIPVWMFSDDAKEIFPHWPSEADCATANIRGIVGRYRGSEQVQTIFRRLRPIKEFRHRWNDGVHAAYGRDPSDLMYARDPATGETRSYSLTITNQSEHVILIILSEHPGRNIETNRP
ncbi:helix-turn-helix domain-containing protein [Nocardia farcinica]|uniref:helix-turn-helix domain-containing protein n=1 Tax=Nocardia farcinica TaxID=37329 RepID=UPI0024577649|nr:helix-turn-helix domain-containing protein [Nocardia farcinica]